MSNHNGNANASKKRAIIYARSATGEQDSPAAINSIARQLEVLRNHAQSNGFEVVEEITSIGPNSREKFEEMVRGSKSRCDCEAILVERTDRLSRNLADLVKLEDLLKELGLEMHVVREGQIIKADARAQDQLIQGIFAVMTRYYTENLRNEIRKGQLARAKSGLYPGRAPFGYRRNTESRAFEIHSEEGRIVKTLFKLCARGTHSLQSLSKALLDTTGTHVSAARVRNMLTNPFYAGAFMWNGTQYKGTHKPLVDEGTFSNVQRKLAA